MEAVLGNSLMRCKPGATTPQLSLLARSEKHLGMTSCHVPCMTIIPSDGFLELSPTTHLIARTGEVRANSCNTHPPWEGVLTRRTWSLVTRVLTRLGTPEILLSVPTADARRQPQKTTQNRKMLQIETRIKCDAQSAYTSDNFWRPGHTDCSKCW